MIIYKACLMFLNHHDNKRMIADNILNLKYKITIYFET